MTVIRIDTDAQVEETVREAVSAACDVLDGLFPGSDGEQSGITSNFAGLLEGAIFEMLKGRSILDTRRGHTTHLPTLLIDESFFGEDNGSGDAYLVLLYGRSPNGARAVVEPLALCPDTDRLRPVAEIADAFTSFSAAAAHAVSWLQKQGASIQEAQEMQLACKAVGFAEDRKGYFVLDPKARRLRAV